MNRLFFAVVLLGLGSPVQAQQCTESPQLGIGRFRCHSGSCFVNIDREGSVVHDFAVEPEVAEVVEGGPADDALEVGDVLVSIDGVLVTTPDGGRRLAQLEPARAVVLEIRRNGSIRQVTIMPGPSCRRPGLIVDGGAEGFVPSVQPPWPPINAAPAVSFGVRLQCGPCGWAREADGGLIFHSTGPVRIEAVTPGGPAAAGLVPGDILVSVDGAPMGSREAARRLGELRPGDRVQMRVRRGDRELDVTLQPIAVPGGSF